MVFKHLKYSIIYLFLGNTCGYEDKQVQDSIRGLTTRFQVVKGQFMNRITGIKESPG
jgi:hypothetical protein